MSCYIVNEQLWTLCLDLSLSSYWTGNFTCCQFNIVIKFSFSSILSICTVFWIFQWSPFLWKRRSQRLKFLFKNELLSENWISRFILLVLLGLPWSIYRWTFNFWKMDLNVHKNIKLSSYKYDFISKLHLCDISN